MKNNYTLAQRNKIVEEHLWCIDAVIRANAPLIKAAHLDRDDVYQQLAVRLIRAVEGFDPDKGQLCQHIFAQLRYELLSCKSAYRTTGMTGAPADYHQNKVISIEDVRERYMMGQRLAA